MMNFFGTASEMELFPLQDPEVVRLQTALDKTQSAAEPAHQAWLAYLHKHFEDVIRVPWPKDKAALSEADLAAQQTVEHVAAALDLALTAATERASEACSRYRRCSLPQPKCAVDTSMRNGHWVSMNREGKSAAMRHVAM